MQIPADVAVVIPHYNRADLLRLTIDSVLQQSAACRVIVVDDGSDTDQWQRIQLYADSQVQVLRRADGPKGPSRSRNVGWQQSDCPFVMFLDSDDLLGGWCLQQRLAAIAEFPEADAWVFPVLLFRNHPGDLRILWNQMAESGDLERFLVSDPPWHTSSTLWRRSALERLGGFNELVMYGDDADLHMRALFGGIRFQRMTAAVPDVFVRRSDANRITNGVSAWLLNSRLVRLSEGSRLLLHFGTDSQRRLWQGQYFRECEYLLFQVPGSWGRICAVLRQWKREWPRAGLAWWIACFYLAVACATRRHAYLLLRIARRVAMRLMPVGCFPQPGGFECTSLDAAMERRVELLLAGRNGLMPSENRDL